MDSTLIERLHSDYPELRFRKGAKFKFCPPRTVVLGPPEPFAELLTLHEVSHAILGHKSFRMDVERLKMESEAWEKARELALKYGEEVNEDLIQEELDTYREWLHQKSRCPRCGLTRFQISNGQYCCPRCESITTRQPS